MYVPHILRYKQNTIYMAAISKFKMDAFTKSSNIINNAFNGLPDPENMGIDTKFIILRYMESKIWQ
jgi:hypothetical protein